MNYFNNQTEVAEKALTKKVFLTGPAGTGKTTTAKAYLNLLRNNKISGSRILILVPQRSLGLVYQRFIDNFGDFNGGIITIQTLGGVAQRMIRLFWPLIAPITSKFTPKKPPIFLTLETAQYYLNRVCEPFFERAYFESIRAEKPRILSQILDNLNKAAVVGFSHEEISERLKSAWSHEPGHVLAYDQAQEMANLFREFCYQNNFLDFSLQIETFQKTIWPSHLCKEYLTHQYDYLIYENCEEDIPVFHDVIQEWLSKFIGGLIIFDENAGFRSFLGADPISAQRFKMNCNEQYHFSDPIQQSKEILTLKNLFSSTIKNNIIYEPKTDFQNSLTVAFNAYYPEMIEKITGQVSDLIDQGVSAGDIAILSPFVSDALRFQLQNRFEKKQIRLTSHRPSRSLREEPLTHVLLTWAKIAHPEWQLIPSTYDLRIALTHCIQGMDPIRADLMVRSIYRPRNEFWLTEIGTTNLAFQERITLSLCNKFQFLYDWLFNALNDRSDLDVFISRFYGEILTQRGFGFSDNFIAADVTSRLVESIQKFRRVVSAEQNHDSINLSKEYIKTLEQGIIAALYLESWDKSEEDSVFLSPAYTFLLQNRSVAYQFWIDVGSMGWWQRLLQPLTQPYVLSRNWEIGRKWTDNNEFETNQLNLEKLIQGLLNRCQEGIYIHSTGYNESGNEEKGPLLKAVQRILRISTKPMEIKDV
ncbi:MAG: hypothetical protein CVU46_03795 [Chloroflexi bacterium HGW-Chloroflexi-8]|jgi:DNA polymerase III delta prime subunit|nr:MAG: hypothetical protein CVU46_03795 [Chloroflexi bacterium HGW-Chloroflexi-8]